MARKEKLKCELDQIVAYSDRVSSLEELARVVGLTRRQVQYRLDKSSEGVCEEVRENIRRVAEATKNNATRTVRINRFPGWNSYIIDSADSADSMILIDGGKRFPLPYDIVYIIHNRIGATKLLVKDTAPKKFGFGVELSCIVLNELYRTDLEDCANHTLTGIDVAVLSHIYT